MSAILLQGRAGLDRKQRHQPSARASAHCIYTLQVNRQSVSTGCQKHVKPTRRPGRLCQRCFRCAITPRLACTRHTMVQRLYWTLECAGNREHSFAQRWSRQWEPAAALRVVHPLTVSTFPTSNASCQRIKRLPKAQMPSEARSAIAESAIGPLRAVLPDGNAMAARWQLLLYCVRQHGTLLGILMLGRRICSICC